MAKTFIIAEKPSVANDLARVLGGFTRVDDYLESDEYVLSSSVGHLLQLVAPNDPVRGKWSFAQLPVIPPEFALAPIDKKAEDRLKLLLRLARRKDVNAIINACDAGREGELIFRYIVQYAGVNKPISRLWLQSMTREAIQEAFKQLRSDAQLKPLEDAARSRAEADWLVGINGTRAMTAFNSKDGGFFKTPVGRVQTPTLAVVVERETRIRKFVPRAYWEVKASFTASQGSYEGRWFDPAFKKNEEDPERRDSRLWTEAQALAVVADCRDQPGTVHEESKPSTQLAPFLFDLTSLQREANGRFGFSAKTTLSIAQALYEKHKVLTYPRTDSRHLPEDYLATVKETLANLGDTDAFGTYARRITQQGWVKPNRRIFDNSKVSDHFAIIPTLQSPKVLSEAEQKIYDLVVRRFLAIFYPAAEYRITTRITKVRQHSFKTEGKVLVVPGWLEVYGRAGNDQEATLIAIEPGEMVSTDTVEAVGLHTRPPARYTEATLLSAMETAGKLVESDELREALAGKGLGTPATRAAIIEGLLFERYLNREGRELVPTAKAFQLMTLLHGLGVRELTSPELTGGWEHKLALIERGGMSRDAFMREIAGITETIVKHAKEYDSDTVPGDYATLETPCPRCGAQVKENYRRFACTACDFSISKHPGGRSFELDEVETLLRERSLGPLTGFLSKQGRPFAAQLRITPEFKLEFDFGQGGDNNAEGETPDFSGQTPLGPCPKCQSAVYDHGMSYVCERSVGPERLCDFRSGKIILQQEIEPEQMRKLLGEGRSDLLAGFVSSRTRRKFKAYLTRQANGTVGFEFEARAEKPKKAAAANAASDKAADGAARKAAASTKARATKTPAIKKATQKTSAKSASKSSAAAAVKPVTKTRARKSSTTDAA